MQAQEGMMAIRTGRSLWDRNSTPSTVAHKEPPPEVIARRPHQAPSLGTCFPTDENLDAQQAWLGHIEAGRIKVG